MAWRQLNKKMTESQITGLLGNPLDKETVEPFQVWYYHGSPKSENGQIVWRPKTGFVRFKKVPVNGQQTFLLLDWKIPLWREVAAMPVEVNEPAPVPVAPIQPVEPIKEQIVKTEVNLPPVAPPPPPQPKPEPKPETSWQDLPAAAINWVKSIPKKWLFIGGGIIAFILYAVFKPDPRYRPAKSTERKRRDD